jgi:hypothetical protein
MTPAPDTIRDQALEIARLREVLREIAANTHGCAKQGACLCGCVRRAYEYAQEALDRKGKSNGGRA